MPCTIASRLFAPLILSMCAAAQPQPSRPAPIGKLVDVGGYRVHLSCTGSGSPTVMVAGAGFSFDWVLVQAEAAKIATICTYDVSGTAWSDAGPPLDCRARMDEVHRLVRAAHIESPMVLAGLSLGACVARLYAAEYPAEVAGMVIVDHAFRPDPNTEAGKTQPAASGGLDSPPALLSQTPIAVTVEDISDFKRLPPRIQQLHRWAMSLGPKLPTWEDAEDCLASLKIAAPGPFPLGNLPLVVVSTANHARGYDRLQSELLALSHQSMQMFATESFHAVEIDQPDVIIAAIGQVLETVRKGSGK